MANSNKGLAICKESSDLLQMNESTFSKVSNRNGQLKKPSEKKESREKILQLYSEYGYEKVEGWFRKKYMKQIIAHSIYNKIPRKVGIKLKKILKG